ncbi:MAG: ATP-binding cassette domain-containing protein [Legionellales bacterium]|jgi:ATP-binding cassette subfamily F protein uup
MPVIHINQLEYAITHVPLLDKVNLTIEPGERVALIGRNGEGKSTFLKIIAGIIQPNRGSIDKQSHIDIAMLSQTLLPANDQTVYEAVAMGLSDIGKVLNEYHQILEQMAHEGDHDALFKRMDKLQQQIEKSNGWLLQQRIERVITELELPSDALMSTLSGGWRRRVAIAQVLVREPDLLLLDEPTNHLDVATIQWLEEVLLNYPKAILFITHDRALLRKMATRIIELDRGHITSYPNNYTMYLELKEKALEDEQRQNALFDKKLSQEEVWIRQGVKARRTRNEGRVRNLEALRAERAKRREQSKNPAFTLNTTSGQSKVIIKADNISFGYEADKPIIKPFSITIQKGDKIALIGPNGAGKTTLIKILMGDLNPNTGTVTQSSHNQIAFYDQHRLQIDPEKTLIENVVEGSDTIELDGARKHVISYLNDFLFSPEKARSLAKGLSGGECNRLLLAKIFAKPANLLILDEPTNDLDVESLEVLETLLQNYSGTAIIISHDREFIDNIATHSIAFKGDGSLKTYFGGYSDWLWQSGEENKASAKKPESVQKNPKNNDTNKRELNAILIKIEKLEKQISDLNEKMNEPAQYTEENLNKLSKLQADLEQDYKQWESLC